MHAVTLAILDHSGFEQHAMYKHVVDACQEPGTNMSAAHGHGGPKGCLVHSAMPCVSGSLLACLLLPSLRKAFVAIVLMMSWMEPPPFGNRAFDMVELFSGQARICRLARLRGWHALCHDWDYDSCPTNKNCMDMTGAAGFVYPSCIGVNPLLPSFLIETSSKLHQAGSDDDSRVPQSNDHAWPGMLNVCVHECWNIPPLSSHAYGGHSPAHGGGCKHVRSEVWGLTACMNAKPCLYDIGFAPAGQYYYCCSPTCWEMDGYLNNQALHYFISM